MWIWTNDVATLQQRSPLFPVLYFPWLAFPDYELPGVGDTGDNLPPYQEILPPNSLPFEKATVYSTRRLIGIPTPLRSVWRWDACPSELLPWLAWSMSVDLWNDKWSDEKKRAIIRESFALHRRKGTLYAIDRYLSFAGSPLRRAIVPPDKPFPGRTMTVTERQTWLDRFPQIRIYRFRDAGTWTFGAFASHGAYKVAKTFLGAGATHTPPRSGTATAATLFPYKTDAWERWGRRAFLWDKGEHFRATGTETQLRWVERTRETRTGTAVDYTRVLIPGSSVQSLFIGAFAAGNHNRRNGRRFLVVGVAASRIVTMSRTSEYTSAEDFLQRFAVRPALEPINVFPEHVKENGTAKRGIQVFCGIPGGRWADLQTRIRHPLKTFLQGFMPSTASVFRLYDRVYLHDKLRLPDDRPRTLHMGHFRLGMPPFHAKLSIEVRGKRTHFEFGDYIWGHFKVPDHKPLLLARQAVQRSMAYRDKILIKTRLHRVIRTSDGVVSGDGRHSGDLIQDI